MQTVSLYKPTHRLDLGTLTSLGHRTTERHDRLRTTAYGISTYRGKRRK